MELKNFKTMDPHILYSIVNARLRVVNPTLEAFCEDNDIDPREFLLYMEENGYCFHPETNQFRGAD
jgi:hypothetical protein